MADAHPIALLALAFTSLAVLALPSTKSTPKPKIRLSEDALDYAEDPLHVLQPVDLLEGDPIDEPKFWTEMRWRKLALGLVLFLILALQAIAFGWSLGEAPSRAVLNSALDLLFTTYTTLLLVLSISSTSLSVHSALTVHLSALTFSATGMFIAAALYPAAIPRSSNVHGEHKIYAINSSILILYILACGVAITMPRGPALHFPMSHIYTAKTLSMRTSSSRENVCGTQQGSVWDMTVFTYANTALALGSTLPTLNIADFPVVPAGIRGAVALAEIRHAMRTFRLRILGWKPTPGSGYGLMYTLLRANARVAASFALLTVLVSVLFYGPKLFLKLLVQHLEVPADQRDDRWGWMYAIGLFLSSILAAQLFQQLSYVALMSVAFRLRNQLNTALFAKTLVIKDVAPAPSSSTEVEGKAGEQQAEGKAQIMTLFTADIERVANSFLNVYGLINCPISVVIAMAILYSLLGISSFVGLAATLLSIPVNHLISKKVTTAQESLMKARDERMSLMNEVLGAIRTLKFFAWERNFEAKVSNVRKRELGYQKQTYIIEAILEAIWGLTPVFIALASFFHYTVIRGQPLTPSVAFTSVAVFDEMRGALTSVGWNVIALIQARVSLVRMEKYLLREEVSPPCAARAVAFRHATVTWPAGTAARFALADLDLEFPRGQLSLVCGRVGAGKTLLLRALLGEADVCAGSVECPRSQPDALARFAEEAGRAEGWVAEGATAYVPQAAWLRNASIKDNILFNLPFLPDRYQKTLEACALVDDISILEDGDESEIGEKGIGLSGGQKARVSLARAVYSRASTLILDDVLSAVDAHTAQHIYHKLFLGELMRDRTVILVSHHVQLFAPKAAYIVMLDAGRVQFAGAPDAFEHASVSGGLVDTEAPADEEARAGTQDEKGPVVDAAESAGAPKKAPRKAIEDETRAVGSVEMGVWSLFVKACGGPLFWSVFAAAVALGALAPLAENWWLKVWSASALASEATRTPMFYLSIYGGLRILGLVISAVRWIIIYLGSIKASTRLYKDMLEAVLLAPVRFHDTTSRGRLLNRFGADFQVIDSGIAQQFGHSVILCLDMLTIFAVVCAVDGPLFVLPAPFIIYLYVQVAKVYSKTAREMRRLNSVGRSPLYSIYEEVLSGIPVVRAFGASSWFMRTMIQHVDTSTNPDFWMQALNRWLSVRLSALSNIVVGVVAAAPLLVKGIDASVAGFTLAFASSIVYTLAFMVYNFVSVEQSLVSLERIKEYTELPREGKEFEEPRPPAHWPVDGRIQCEDLEIRYAPDLPAILHGISFDINPGEKVGIIGRTGSGKSTLALSLFRFIEATGGRIMIDGLDISEIGLTDLRGRLTIIPQDPTIMSGTLRSTLDVFNEHEDADIFEALRRVHLIPEGRHDLDIPETINANVFRSLDSSISEGGGNLSAGQKQLLCMARAILRRSKILVMDEATSSIDYATDDLIAKTIREEFASSTVITIAHRLRSVIRYDRVMVLDQGRIAEFDRPAKLLSDEMSRFRGLCEAAGPEEFAFLNKASGTEA